MSTPADEVKQAIAKTLHGHACRLWGDNCEVCQASAGRVLDMLRREYKLTIWSPDATDVRT